MKLSAWAAGPKTFRTSPERHPVELRRDARFDPGYTVDVAWQWPAFCEGMGGYFFFNITRVQMLVSNGRVICQTVGTNHDFKWDTWAEDGRFTITAEEIGQLMGGN